MRLAPAALGVVLLLLACSAEGPHSTADRFWSAIRDGDPEAAMSASNASELSELEVLASKRTITNVSFEEPLENEDSARIPTLLELADGRAPIRFDTHLVKSEDSDGEWRVDLGPTARALSAAEFAALFDSAAEVVREGVIELGEALEEGAREALRAIEESMRELEFEADEGEQAPSPERTTADERESRSEPGAADERGPGGEPGTAP